MTTGTSKRPDTTSGPSGFAEEHKREKMAELHNQQLTVEEWCAYEEKAAEKDMACKTLPERSENLKCVDSRLLSAKVNPHHRTSSAESWKRWATLSGGIGANMAKLPSSSKAHSGMQTMS